MKSLFNFYLDDDQKQKATAKLAKLCGDQPKGLLASFLRIQIKLFNATPEDKVDPRLIEAIAAEYEFTQKCNKRSNL